ncbi:hypothetical protein BaRGS_00009017 [Batillaria attramentaria]|uniref:B box-type domain-containing protein n=1 Tax=Batillaria attramentaria TaxID=370345 RepID=A0ABD0LJI7_9CAEN
MASKRTSLGHGVQVVSAKDLYSKVLPRRLRGKSLCESISESSKATASASAASTESTSANPSSKGLSNTSAISSASAANTAPQPNYRRNPCAEEPGGGSGLEVPTIAPGYRRRSGQGRTYSGFDDPAQLKRRHSSYLASYIERELSSGPPVPSSTNQSEPVTSFRQLQRRFSDNGAAQQSGIGQGEQKAKPPKKPPRRHSKEDWCPSNLAGTFLVKGDSRVAEKKRNADWLDSGLKRPTLERGDSVTLEEGETVVCPSKDADAAASESSKEIRQGAPREYVRLVRSGDRKSCTSEANKADETVSDSFAQPSTTEMISKESVDHSSTGRDVGAGGATAGNTEPARLDPSDLRKRDRTSESSFSDGVGSLPKTETNDNLVCKDDSISVLQTCAACLQPCEDLKLLLCFHIMCPACASSGCSERDGSQVIVCAVCQAEHATSPEGPTSLSDVYPGLLTESFSCSKAAACSLETENITSGKDASQRYSDASLTSEGQRSSVDLKPPESASRERSASCVKSAKPGDALSQEDAKNATSSTARASNVGEDVPENTANSTFTDTHKSQASSGSSQDSTATSESQTRVCGACLTRSDTCHTCVTCGGVLLCEGCRTAHLNLPVTRSHEVLALDSVSPLVLLARRQLTCSVHGQDLALMCSTCGLFLCHRCLTPQHARHDTKELASVFHSKRKQLSTLQRTIKQHVLAVKSAGRTLDEHLAKVERSRQKLCEAIQETAQRHVQQINTLAADLAKEVNHKTDGRREVLEKDRAVVRRAKLEGQKLRCVLGAVTDQTPHLTSLTLLHTCQARYEALRNEAPLSEEDFEDLVFCPDPRLDVELGRQAALGSLRTVSQGVPDTVMTAVGSFRVCRDLSGLAVTPYGEVVSISTNGGSCQVWDCQGVMLMDASRHVTRPTAVHVLTSGVIAILDADKSATAGTGKGGNSCLKLLSPAGTLLSQLPLSSPANATRVHCPNEYAVLVSDGLHKTVTLCSMEKGSSVLTKLRTVSNERLLSAPRHVTVNVTADWVVSDGGSTLKVITPDGEINTLLSNDEIEAVLQPPRRSCYAPRPGDTRALGDVCCDSRGHVIAADVGKCGLYVITGGSANNRERHFVSLKALAPSTRMATICIDGQDRIYVGMQDGSVSILKIGAQDEDKDTNTGSVSYVNLAE